MARVLMCFLLAACGACTAPLKDTATPHETGPVTSLYLVSHGWHVGLVIRQIDIPVSAWPWGQDFPEAAGLKRLREDFFQAGFSRVISHEGGVREEPL